MARLNTWKMIYPLFTPKEFGVGGYEGMDDSFLLSLYRFRVAIDTPMIINPNGGFSTRGHSPTSLHYSGRAVDFHFTKDIPLRRVIVAAIKSGLHGIGLYPYWNNMGFHLDNRTGNKFNIWVRDKNNVYRYIFPTNIPEYLKGYREIL